MIINGGSRSNSEWFTKHLGNADDNERVTLCEVKGLTASSIKEGFREMAAVASVTKCKNWFYHVNINPRDNEQLTAEQWERAIDLLEENLGLTGNARFVVEHKKGGRVHRHIIWSRIDVDRLRAVAMTHDYEKHQATARFLEREFNLEPEKSVLGEDRNGPRPERRPENWETFRGKRSGINPQDVKNEVTGLWQTATNGHDFADKLKKHGYVLAKGDRRDFCILDKAGDAHSLARRISGINSAQLREFMKDIDREALPSVAEARARILGRGPGPGSPGSRGGKGGGAGKGKGNANPSPESAPLKEEKPAASEITSNLESQNQPDENPKKKKRKGGEETSGAAGRIERRFLPREGLLWQLLPKVRQIVSLWRAVKNTTTERLKSTINQDSKAERPAVDRRHHYQPIFVERRKYG